MIDLDRLRQTAAYWDQMALRTCDVWTGQFARNEASRVRAVIALAEKANADELNRLVAA